jgi:hypothetical protein
MEEASVDPVQFLVGLVWPVGLIAIGLGVLTVGATGVAAALAKHRNVPVRPQSSSMLERIVVGVCAAVSSLGLVAAVQIIRLSRVSLPRFPLLGVLFAVSLLLLALPAVLWETRLRWVAEGFALVALGTSAILGMWSIGFLFLPLVLPMVWVCIQHLRETALAGGPFGGHGRVDSPG